MTGQDWVVLKGEIDMARRDEVQQILDGAVARAISAGHELLIDLGQLSFIDSTGLACLVRASGAMSSAGLGLWLCQVPPAIGRLLEVAGLAHLVKSG